MGTRREKVLLELESDFPREMAKAAAATALFKRELHGVSSESTSFSRTAVTIERDSSRVGSSIDKLSGRLHLLAQSAAALGPALIPVATAAVPAIAGLTTELGFAVAAGGTMVLAFHGVADTLEALNKAQLEPTEANLKKLREEASHLSPAAKELVFQLDKMGPAFRQVRDAAQEGLLPGVSKSLDEMEDLLPRVARIVGEIGDVTGELLASGAESLAGPEWEDFFRFIESEARPTLMTLGHTVGNVTKGLAEMWMAFDPLSDDFTSGLLDASERFEAWAESLSDSEDFRAFVEYIRATGPQVLETLGDIGNMFLQIGEAAAPLGGPVLEILGSIADAVAVIADSDLGTPIMTGVAALSAMNLALTLTKKAGDTAFGSMVKKQGEAALSLRGLRAELELTRQAYLRTGDPALLTKLAEGAEKSRAGFAALGKGAALAAGGIAVMETDLAQTKTAIFGLTGAMLGGAPGAVAGGLIGALADVAGANDDFEASLQSTQRAIGGLDYTAIYDGLADALQRRNEIIADLEPPDSNSVILAPFTQSPSKSLGQLKNAYKDIFGQSDVEEERKKFDELAASVESADRAVGAIAAALGEDITPIWAKGRIAAEDWVRTVERATPAMIALRISAEDLANATPDEQDQMATQIARWTREAESAEGRTRHFAQAVKDLGDETLTTEQRADALADALAGLFDPKMDLDAALNDWKQGLLELASNLDTVMVKTKNGLKEVAGSRSLFDDSEGALQNQDALRTQAQQIKDVLEAMARDGASAEKVAKTFRDQRDALIETGVAAGLSRDEVVKYLKQIGLTPKSVNTLFELLGIPKAEEDVERLNRKLDHMARHRVAKITIQAINSGDRFGTSITDRDGDGKPDYASADGSTVPGPRLPYGDKVHALLAPGEEVISNRYGQADAWRPLLKAINANRLADGGTVARSVPYMPGLSLSGLAAELAPMLANLRPLYGPVQVNGDPTVFRKQMEADAALAGMDGIRMGAR